MILLDKFRALWAAKKYVLPGELVLLAVSGGEDSMVMAHLFLHSKIGFAVAHCNFGLRGEASDEDELFVRNWCERNSVKCFSVKFDTKQKSQDWKKGTQETARILRYEWFEIIRQQHNFKKIVTAHHANDNIETFMINLFKGTGIGGLHGILPENGHIVRPLLFASKEMISNYAAANEITWREDASNASDDYLRNAVRHNIVPAVKEWFPNVVTNLNESIVRFSEAELLYRQAIDQKRKKLIEQRGADFYIPIRKLRHQQPLATICYELLQPFGFSAGQAQQVLNLLDSTTGHYVSSETHRVIRNRDFLIVTTAPAETADFILVEGTPCTIDTGKYVFSFSVQDTPKTVPANANEAYLNLDEISFPLLLRKKRNGDYLYPLGMKMKKKKVSRVLIDDKVPLHEKEDVRVLECNKRIAWIAGNRIDERFKIKEGVSKVLVVKRALKTFSADAALPL